MRQKQNQAAMKHQFFFGDANTQNPKKKQQNTPPTTKRTHTQDGKEPKESSVTAYTTPDEPIKAIHLTSNPSNLDSRNSTTSRSRAQSDKPTSNRFSNSFIEVYTISKSRITGFSVL